MSTDNYGDVQDSMLFNPHIVDPMNIKPNAYVRLFPKTSSIVSGRLFGMDCLDAMTNVISGGYTKDLVFPAFSPNTFAHYPSQGFDVLLTDGSVQFVQSVQAFNYLPLLGPNNYQYSLIYKWLENGQ